MADTVTTVVTELPDSRVRVEAQVAGAEVEKRLEQAARDLGRQMKISGFRKGKVPPPVVIRRLGRRAVLEEAVHSSIGAWYLAAIDGAGISPVGEPKLDIGESEAAGDPLEFTIEIGVRPRAKLGDYKGLEVGRREPEVTEEMIGAELERMRDSFATLDTVERAAQAGDHVVMDYAGSVDGESFNGGQGRDQLVELGSGRLIPGFEEQLVGAEAGDEREVEVTFPEDYGAEQLAGKEARFDVTVKEVKAKRLPELDDEFAAQAAGFDTLAELREDIETRAKEIEEHNIEHEFERAVLDAAVDGAQVEIPGDLVHARAHEMLEDTFNALARQGISKENYLQITGMDEEQLAHEAEPDAARGLRREAVIAAIVEAESIEATDEEVLEALERGAKDRDSSPEKLLERLRTNGRLERIRSDVAQRKALELLVAQAKPISVAQAQARDKLWTPDKGKDDETATGKPKRPRKQAKAPSEKLWTPGS
jgi:trigger factor